MVLPKFLGKIKLHLNILFLHTEPTMFDYMHPAKTYVSYVRLSFIQSVQRNHPVRIPLVFKVQYFKCSFADIKLGLCQTSSGCCLHPQWHHMHLRIGPGQSIGYRDICFHRPSWASVFHRHMKRMVIFSISFLIINIPVDTRTFKRKA